MRDIKDLLKLMMADTSHWVGICGGLCITRTIAGGGHTKRVWTGQASHLEWICHQSVLVSVAGHTAPPELQYELVDDICAGRLHKLSKHHDGLSVDASGTASARHILECYEDSLFYKVVELGGNFPRWWHQDVILADLGKIFRRVLPRGFTVRAVSTNDNTEPVSY